MDDEAQATPEVEIDAQDDIDALELSSPDGETPN